MLIATEATERFEREERCVFPEDPFVLLLERPDLSYSLTLTRQENTDSGIINRRRVTEDTLGAIIQIIDYDIVAQQHGPKRTKITMLIKTFSHVGSDGSTPFGFPRHVDSLEPIIELLDQLQTLRAQEHSMSRSPASSKPARDHMQSPSQATSISSADDSLDRSQAIFATQVPGLQPRKRLRDGSPKPDENQPVDFDKSISGRSMALAVGGMGVMRPLVPDSAHTHEAELVSPNCSQHDLSKLLEDKVGWNAYSDGVSAPAKRDEVSRMTSDVNEAAIKAKRNNALLSLLADRKSKPVQQEATVKTVVQAQQSSLSPTNLSSTVGKATPPIDLVPQRQVTPVADALAERHSESPSSPGKGNRITKSSKASTPPSKPSETAMQSRKV